MTIIRSLVFNVLFYANLIVQMIVFGPFMLLGSEATGWRIVKNWARSSVWLLEHVGGVRSHITGLDHVPPGPSIIAAKHQSFWDVFAIIPGLDRPTFILKKELMGIPLFGWLTARMGMIPVDRSQRGGAVASMIEGARKAIAEGRQIVIFPEGTRTAPGAVADYRQGVFRLYDDVKVPVVPMALNSGLYWPRRTFVRRPGTIRAEYLPVIEPGMNRGDFLSHLRDSIETRSTDLMAEAYARDGHLPAPQARGR
ncbi:lysophospholipid acyltransferase family protein [Aurantimonas sp. A2-1-M11]|uniref:lysophospholipid acyltransferase family protein n=1 Tax=Aurantimonas sp. A2-1-M11 TaxID=3113712 RepID=UPI002F958EA3